MHDLHDSHAVSRAHLSCLVWLMSWPSYAFREGSEKAGHAVQSLWGRTFM